MSITFHAQDANTALVYAEYMLNGRCRLVSQSGNVWTYERFKG